MSWLRRLDEYDRPWVGRVALALGVVLWLFVSVVGFAAGVGTGLAISIVGAAFILGEVWSARSGERHETVLLTWRLSWNIGLGAALIVVGAVSSDRWTVAVMAAFGAWLIVEGFVVARLRWLEIRTTAGGGNS